jgi:predicted GIY-YIG superfamily endonuclease
LVCDDALTAIAREKELKKWRRDWKIRLIEEQNPEWVDLYPGDIQLRPVVMDSQGRNCAP